MKKRTLQILVACTIWAAADNAFAADAMLDEESPQRFMLRHRQVCDSGNLVEFRALCEEYVTEIGAMRRQLLSHVKPGEIDVACFVYNGGYIVTQGSTVPEALGPYVIGELSHLPSKESELKRICRESTLRDSTTNGEQLLNALIFLKERGAAR